MLSNVALGQRAVFVKRSQPRGWLVAAIHRHTITSAGGARLLER